MTTYRVTTRNTLNGSIVSDTTFNDEIQAINYAQIEAIKAHRDQSVYIEFKREYDGQQGYVNHDGSDVVGVPWVFNIDEALTDVDVTETTLADEVWREKVVKLGELVTLLLFDSGQVTITIADMPPLEFYFTDQVAEVIDNYENTNAMELLEVIGRHAIM